MPATLEALSHGALLLPPDQRVALAYRLLISVETELELGADAAWEARIARRNTRVDARESLPSALDDDEDGVAEALRRDAELDADPSIGITLEQLDNQLRHTRGASEQQ